MLEELKIGIIGTGAEGCQLLQQANEWNLDLTMLSPTPPANSAIPYKLGDPLQAHDLIAFGKECTHLLVTDPHVHRGALKSLQQMGIKISPDTGTLDWMANPQKLAQELLARSIPVTPERWSATLALESATSHSIHRATAIAQLAEAQASSPGNGTSHKYSAQLPGSLEPFNRYEEEAGTVEVLLARWPDGWVECYTPVMMLMQAERMLADFRMRAPGIHSKTAINACQLAAKVADMLELNGLINIMLQCNDADQLSFKAIRVLPKTHNGFTDSGTPRSAYEQERRAMLGLPTGPSFRDAVRNNSKILEPAAHQRYAREEALKLILGLHHPAPDSNVAAAMAQCRTRKNLADIDMEDFISKTLMVRHLLSSVS